MKLLTREKVVKENYKLKRSESNYLQMKAGTDSAGIICMSILPHDRKRGDISEE